ncbi:MAG: hypothetical protein HFI90_11430 [Clostridia bacterium]|nr:hypothetical protein [Clostridia bacterium]
MRILAVQMSDELFDKLGQHVKEANMTKQNYVNEVIRNDLMSHRQTQEVAVQKIWDRESVAKAIDDYIKVNEKIPSQKEFKNENGLPSYNAAGRCLAMSPAEYAQQRFEQWQAEQEENETNEPIMSM